MSPLELMQRLAALVVPRGPPADKEPATEAQAAAACDDETAQARPGCISWSRLLKRVFSYDVT